jgi:hypothetical protein
VKNGSGSVGTGSGPAISNPNVTTPSVARYEKFEVQFDVATQANPNLPYDSASPPGITSGSGVSVDGLFSSDNWGTTLTQPGFVLQPYTYTDRSDRDHFTPSGAPHWAVRFAPQQAGAWQFRLRAQDASGTRYYPDQNSPALSFTVGATSSNATIRRGFLRVSPTDKRYFAFQDGAPFVGVGFNGGVDFSTIVEPAMHSYEQNKINFLRIWLAGAGINGSQWTSWASPFLGNDGYLPGTSFSTADTYQGADVALKLDAGNACFFTDFWQGGIPAEPNTTYQIWARVKLNGVTGSGAYGFVIKHGGWLDTSCTQAGAGTPITTPLTGSTGWTTVSGTYTTGSDEYWLDYLYLARQNAAAGDIVIDEVRVYRADDPAQVNLLREPNANSHLYFDPMNSAQWDRFLQSAQQHGVYLKLVIDEKNEWIRNHLAADGSMTAEGDNNNFYAADGTLSRWLQQAWWRYMIARWGYNTAIHSFEYVNEGDPYNGQHYDAAQAMAHYFHQTDPSHHLVTTSFWSSYPGAEFWTNPQYSDIDYADLHAYISTGWGLTASFMDDSHLDTNPADIHSGNASAVLQGGSTYDTAIVPRGLSIQGQGEWIVRYWMKASNFTASCSFGSSGGMQRVRWMLDGGTYWGGREGVVPYNSQGQDYICTSPAGTFNWTQFSSDRDRSGTLLPQSVRLVINDNQPHAISLRLENSSGSGGTAWFDDVELVSPSGKVTPVIGQFDVTIMDEDTAWYNRAYGDLFGAASPVGADKPLVRGETGIDFPGNQDWNRELTSDTQGIWLHNNVWGQINPGGMYDLFWWATETIPSAIYPNFLTYRTFMEGIPLDNGNYHDLGAQTSVANLRAWGQRDDVNGRMHVWIQNMLHTWKRVVHGDSIPPLSGTVTIPNVPTGQYQVQWWNTYAANNPVFLTQTVASNGQLVLTLPNTLADDVAVKVTRLP